MLVLSRKVNQSIMVGDNVRVVVVAVDRDQVKLGIEAPARDRGPPIRDLRRNPADEPLRGSRCGRAGRAGRGRLQRDAAAAKKISKKFLNPAKVASRAADTRIEGDRTSPSTSHSHSRVIMEETCKV